MLSYALPQFELYLVYLNDLGTQEDDIKPWTDLVKQTAAKYYTRMNKTDAYVITQCTFLYLYYIHLALTYSLQFLILQKISKSFLNIGAQMVRPGRMRLY
jgi:hypothetical protein